MTVITPIVPSEPFDPFDQLINARLAQIEAEFARINARAGTVISTASIPTLASNTNVSGAIALSRVGNTVQAIADVTVKTANYLRNAAGRAIVDIPVGYRPATPGLDGARWIAYMWNPATAEACGITSAYLQTTTITRLYLQGHGATSHPADANVRTIATWLTSDDHPSL